MSCRGCWERGAKVTDDCRWCRGLVEEAACWGRLAAAVPLLVAAAPFAAVGEFDFEAAVDGADGVEAEGGWRESGEAIWALVVVESEDDLWWPLWSFLWRFSGGSLLWAGVFPAALADALAVVLAGAWAGAAAVVPALSTAPVTAASPLSCSVRLAFGRSLLGILISSTASPG